MSNFENCGSLDASEIFSILGFHRRSGRIQVVYDGDAYGFQVLKGQLIFATSSHRTLRLGHLLLQRGAVQPTYLHDVLRGTRTVARDSALGGVLYRDGAIGLDDLAAGIEEQAVEILSRVFALDDATYMYHGEEPVPPGIEIVPLDTDQLMNLAASRHCERVSAHVMQRLLPPRDCTIRLSAQLGVISHLLSDAELLVALSIDRGQSNIDRLEAALPLDQLTIHRTVISLQERGYIVTGEPPLRFDE